MDLAQLIFLSFTFFGSIRVFAYLPQIIRIARDRHGAEAISCSTWLLWAASNASTAAYASVCLKDPAMTWINILNTLCCVIVLALTIWKRREYHARKLAYRYRTGTTLRTGGLALTTR